MNRELEVQDKRREPGTGRNLALSEDFVQLLFIPAFRLPPPFCCSHPGCEEQMPHLGMKK